MKVYQIIVEAESFDIKRSTVLGPDGKPFFTVVDQDGKELFRGTEEQANIKRDELQRNIRRPSSSANTDSRLVPGHRPETPSSDDLTAGERRRLASRGSITRNGVTYTAANIQSATAEKARLANVDTGLSGQTRPGSNAPAVDDAAFKGKFMQGLNGVWNSKIGRFFRGFLGGAAQTKLMAAFNVMVLEDVLDAYLRSIRDYGVSLNDKSQAERDQFTRMIVDGDVSSIPPSVQRGYLQAIEQTTKVFVEAVIGLILSLGWAGIVALGAFGISTGGLGILASIAAGGAFIWGGTTLVNKILEEVGVIDAIENWIATEMLSPVLMFRVARGVDGWQEYLGVGADVVTGGLAGDLIRDDINEEAAATDVKVDPKAAEKAIKDLVRSNPKLMKAYRNGKEEAKAEMRSTTAAT